MTFWRKRIPMKLIWRGRISKPSRDTAADKTANFPWQLVDGWATFCIITVLPLINHSYCKKGTSINSCLCHLTQSPFWSSRPFGIWRETFFNIETFYKSICINYMGNTPQNNAYIVNFCQIFTEGPFQIWTFMLEYKSTYVSVRPVGLRYFFSTRLLSFPEGGLHYIRCKLWAHWPRLLKAH